MGQRCISLGELHVAFRNDMACREHETLHIRRRAADMAVVPAPSATTPADSPDGARAGMVQEAHPTIAGDEETYGGGAPGAPSRQEGPQGPKKRDRAAADPGTVSGGLPDIADGTHDSAVAHDTTRRRKRRRQHPVSPAQAARRHQRTQAYGPQSPQPESLGGCEH